jgi:hypothetical protein
MHSIDNPLNSDHPILGVWMSRAPINEILQHTVTPNRQIITNHADEFREHLSAALNERMSSPDDDPVTAMRWAAAKIKEVGQALTIKYRRAPGKKYMYYPRALQRLHDKLRGAIPMGVGESPAMLKNRTRSAMRKWAAKRFERMLQIRNETYEKDMKSIHRRLAERGSDDTHTIDEAARQGHYTTAADRDECARRVVGGHWKTPEGYRPSQVPGVG